MPIAFGSSGELLFYWLLGTLSVEMRQKTVIRRFADTVLKARISVNNGSIRRYMVKWAFCLLQTVLSTQKDNLPAQVKHHLLASLYWRS